MTLGEAPLRTGLIGAGGNMKLRHIPGFRATGEVELVSVCNRSEASGRRVADEFGIPRIEPDPAALIAAPDIDAVCIGTWPDMHRELTVAALAAGKHVLCEARMATDAAAARAMLAAAEARPDLVAQLVPAPFDLRSWRTVRRLLDDGSIGEVREVHVTVLGANALDTDAPLHWRERVDRSGMNVMQFGIYVEIVSRWLGPTRSVLAQGATFIRERTDAETGERASIAVPDSLGVFAELERGGRVTYRFGSLLHAAPAEANGISVYGSAGTLHWRPGDTMTFAPLGEAPAPLDPAPGTAGEWRVEQDFVDSIRRGAPVTLTSFDDGLHYMRVIEAVYRSRVEARRVAAGGGLRRGAGVALPRRPPRPCKVAPPLQPRRRFHAGRTLHRRHPRRRHRRPPPATRAYPLSGRLRQRRLALRHEPRLPRIVPPRLASRVRLARHRGPHQRLRQLQGRVRRRARALHPRARPGAGPHPHRPHARLALDVLGLRAGHPPPDRPRRPWRRSRRTPSMLSCPPSPASASPPPLAVDGLQTSKAVDLWARLMTETLGYERFATGGGDFGAMISSMLGARYPERVRGVYLTLPSLPAMSVPADLPEPGSLRQLLGLLNGPATRAGRDAFAPDERHRYDVMEARWSTALAHIAVHTTDPQTLAFALHDSPAGLAAWLVERRRNWSDNDGDVEQAFSRRFLLDTVSIYWFTESFVTTSRWYWHTFRTPPQAAPDPEAARRVPYGLPVFPKEMVFVPRAAAEASANVVHWTEQPRGGHFAPAEVPDLFVEDLRAFARQLR